MDSDRIGKLHRSGEGRVKLVFKEQDFCTQRWGVATKDIGDGWQCEEATGGRTCIGCSGSIHVKLK